MIWIEGEGFIKESCLESIEADGKVSSDLLNVLVGLNSFSEELKKDFVVFRHDTPEEKQKVISIVVFIRILEIIQAFIVLAKIGIHEELHSLFRIFLDAYFVLANCCTDQDFIPVYFLSDERARLKILNSSLKYESDLFKKTKEYAQKERDELDKRVKDEKIQAFNSFLFAKNVGCEELYDSLYRISSASIHTSPRCLENYVETDEEGNILLIKHYSDPQETNSRIYDISYFFIKAISGICKLFALDYDRQINDFNKKLEKIASALDDT